MAQHTQNGGAGDADLRQRIAKHLPDGDVDGFLKHCKESHGRCTVLEKDNVYELLQDSIPPPFRENPRRATAAVLREAANNVVSHTRSSSGKGDLLSAARVAQKLMESDSTRHAYDEWLKPSVSVRVPDFDALPYFYALLAAPFRLLWQGLVKGPQVAAIIWFWTKVALVASVLTLLWGPLNDLRQWWSRPDQARPVVQNTGGTAGGAPPAAPVSPQSEPGGAIEPPDQTPAPAPPGGSLGSSPPIDPEPDLPPRAPEPSPEPVEPSPPAPPPRPVLPSGPGGKSTDAEGLLITVSPKTLPVDGVGVASPPVDLPPVHVGGSVPRPRKTWDVRPDLPRLTTLRQVQDFVILEVHVDATGAVEDAIVLRSAPLLDDAAVAAVRQWRYEPTVIDGQPRAAILTETIRFSID